MRGAVLVLLLAASFAIPAGERSRAARAAFQRENPCPATGAPRGPCRGWEVDHVVALCAGGADTPANMQWLTIEQHRVKTRRDRLVCRRRE